MSQLDHFLDIKAETLKNWPHIDTSSGRVRFHMWRMARQFQMDDRKRRLFRLARFHNFKGFMASIAGSALYQMNKMDEIGELAS